jgi:hypothetical protein
MDVFQDLIEELRDEQLLEETVIESIAAAETGTLSEDDPVMSTASEESFDETDRTLVPEGESEGDFYRKRAIAEVSSLQMVEHVLSGIEREYLKIVPRSYDDLQAKKALHQFIQVHADPSSTDYAEAEFRLMRETEAWSTALAARDGKITPAHLRRFCENSRPGLSSQALMSLGRFYRNTAYTEASRAKFDLVMTRLFARELDDQKRRLLFSRVDMIGHIRTLYANWASVALYSSDESEIRTRTVVAGFEDRVTESANAESFDVLLQTSFFDKVRQFKEATGEMFFTPDIVAASIDCNVRIGNKLVDLVYIERQRTPSELVEEKYGYEHDQIISEAACKTLKLVELLKSLPDPEDSRPVPAMPVESRPAAKSRAVNQKKQSVFSGSLLGVNKWLLALTILVALASGSLYFWADQPTQETSGTEKAKDVNLQKTPLKAYLGSGRATTENFYAIAQPAWDELSDEQKKEVLQQALQVANEQGLRTVSILNAKGRTVAFAGPNRSELLNPGS